MLEKVKAALGITSRVFNEEIEDNIAAALADMEYTTDITYLERSDSLISRAIISYCAYMHNMLHGSADLSDKFKKAYEEQKKALLMSSQYTNYGEN